MDINLTTIMILLSVFVPCLSSKAAHARCMLGFLLRWILQALENTSLAIDRSMVSQYSANYSVYNSDNVTTLGPGKVNYSLLSKLFKNLCKQRSPFT